MVLSSGESSLQPLPPAVGTSQVLDPISVKLGPQCLAPGGLSGMLSAHCQQSQCTADMTNLWHGSPLLHFLMGFDACSQSSHKLVHAHPCHLCAYSCCQFSVYQAANIGIGLVWTGPGPSKIAHSQSLATITLHSEDSVLLLCTMGYP